MILVGTLHTDPKGSEKLRKVLDTYSPRKITLEAPSTLEISEYEALVIDYKNFIKEQFPATEDFLGFEALTVAKYARDTGSAVYLVDHPIVLESYKKENILNLIRTLGAPEPDYLKKIREMEDEREQYMAEHILRIRPDMHIGGMNHVFERGVHKIPLFKRLESLNPQRIALMKLDELDATLKEYDARLKLNPTHSVP